MYAQTLQDAGFSKHQARVYTYLIENGPQTASIIARQTNIARTLVYRVLDELALLGLLERQDEKGAVSLFVPAHPIKLHDLAEQKKKEAERMTASVASVVDPLTSSYNKVLGKPGVRFFEGEAGVEYVLEDSLKAEGLIYTYADIEAIVAHIDDINTRYVAKREKMGKKKKAFLVDSPRARAMIKNYHREITDTKLLTLNTPPFGSVMEIYNNTISYITLQKKQMIGVIIEDASIAQMHKSLFEYLWEKEPNR